VPEGYRLDLTGLGRLIDQLALAEDQMKSATRAMLDAHIEDLGTWSLDHETKAFHDRWRYGIGKLADAADEMVDGLNATRKAYTDTEDHVASYFPQGADAVAPGPRDTAVDIQPGDGPNSSVNTTGIWTAASPISRRMGGSL
jgi:hypothetical protein